VEDILEGNPDRQTAAELHARAWPLVESILGAPVHQALRTFEEARHTERTAETLEEILPATVAGRVEALLVAEGASRWGRFDPQTGQVQVSAESETPEEEEEELVDRAVLECLTHGGEVFTLPREEFPTPGPLAAIFRF
jgi:hypothetical protein